MIIFLYSYILFILLILSEKYKFYDLNLIWLERLFFWLTAALNLACPVKFIEDKELAQLNHGMPFNRGEANLTGGTSERLNLWNPIFDVATKRRIKHKNKISGLVISMCYNEQKSKVSLSTNPSYLHFVHFDYSLLGSSAV